MQEPDMKHFTKARQICNINLIKDWNEKELNFKFKSMIVDTKVRFKGVRSKLSDWPETCMKNF